MTPSRRQPSRQQRRQRQRRASPGEAPPSSPLNNAPPRRHAWFLPWLAILAIIILGCIAYANSFSGAFLFDDIQNIVQRPWLYGSDAVEQIARRSDRPLTDITFVMQIRAQDGKLGQPLDPEPFHRFNLGVHLIAALALFGIVRRTMRLPLFNGRFDAAAVPVAAIVAALWTVHPLQTQAVTYIVQRAESMMAMFYLLTLYFYIRGATGGMHRWMWFLAAVLSCFAGMAAKPIMVTAPVLILLFDYCLLSQSWTRTLVSRWPALLGLALAWIMLAFSGIAQDVLDPTREPGRAVAGFSYQQPETGQMTWLYYFLTQPQVILHYLRLSVWPWPLVLDYKWPLVESFTEAAIPLLVMLAAGLATLWALWKRPPIGFIGAAFFIVLAPTSSIMPVIDVAFEHRMYLPLAAVITLIVLIGLALAPRLWAWMNLQATLPRLVTVALPVAAVLVTMIIVTQTRNRDYHDPVRMWRSVLRNGPHGPQPRALNNLAAQLVDASKNTDDPAERQALDDEACALFQQVVDADPEASEVPLAAVYYNLAKCAKRDGDLATAIENYQVAIQYDARMLEPYIEWGNALSMLGQHRNAEEMFRKAIEIGGRPRKPERAILVARASFNMGNELWRQNRIDDAIDAYIDAAEIFPLAYSKGYFRAGQLYESRGESERAVQMYERVLRHQPQHTQARARLQVLQRATVEG